MIGRNQSAVISQRVFPASRHEGRAGAGLKPEHLPAILEQANAVGFFEVHAENYMGAGGPPHAALTRIRNDYPVTLHGICMSIGGPDALDRDHLARFRTLVERYEPALVSEHLAWSTHDNVFFNDLLPLPYTERTLARVADHIDEVFLIHPANAPQCGKIAFCKQLKVLNQRLHRGIVAVFLA